MDKIKELYFTYDDYGNVKTRDYKPKETKTMTKHKIHVKDQYCAGPNCDCGYGKHNPTPWKYDESHFTIAEDKRGGLINVLNFPANVELNMKHIVKAVNDYEKNIKKIEYLQGVVDIFTKTTKETSNCIKKVEGINRELVEALKDVLRHSQDDDLSMLHEMVEQALKKSGA